MFVVSEKEIVALAFTCVSVNYSSGMNRYKAEADSTDKLFLIVFLNVNDTPQINGIVAHCEWHYWTTHLLEPSLSYPIVSYPRERTLMLCLHPSKEKIHKDTFTKNAGFNEDAC